MSVLAMTAMAAAPAQANGSGEEEPPACFCAPGADDGAADDENADEAEYVREAVPGRVPARIRERVASAVRSLHSAESAAERGADARAAAHLKQARRQLTAAHDAALERAEDELPGGAAAVRAVTKAQHAVVETSVSLLIDSDGRLYDAAADTLDAVVGDRDDAVVLLLETEGVDDELDAIADELTSELETLEGLAGDEDEELDEDLAETLDAIGEALNQTGDRLGLREEEEEE
ncbi:MAG: hypothetical protein JHC95_05400 [Solirubrobacteraceae bacterium]|nr:hypothetical protein [Solirubrobacteraceae bacterium]